MATLIEKSITVLRVSRKYEGLTSLIPVAMWLQDIEQCQ